MPTPYIEKLSREGKGSVKDLESKWDKAKKLAADEGHAEEYDYITGIFNKMVGASTTTALKEGPAKIMIRSNAIARLRETAAPDPGLAKLRNQSALIRGRLDALKGKTGTNASKERTRLNKQLTEVRTKISNWKNIKKTKASVEVAVTDIKGAAAALEKIFKKHKFNVTCKPKKGTNWDEPHITVNGKTEFGKVNFDVYLSKSKKDLVLDWWDGSGLYSFDEAVMKAVDKNVIGAIQGTKERQFNGMMKDLDTVIAIGENLNNIMSKALQVNENFYNAMEEIKRVMEKNPVKPE